MDDVLAAVGRGEMFSGDVVKAIHPEFVPERASGGGPSKGEAGWFGLNKADSLVFKVPGSVRRRRRVRSPFAGLAATCRSVLRPWAARCRRPDRRHPHARRRHHDLPDPVPALTQFDDQTERWLDVRWDIEEEHTGLYPAQIVVSAINEPGTLALIAGVIGETGANIDHVQFVNRSPTCATL